MTTVLFAVKNINEFLWSGPLLLLLMGTHLYFTIKLHFPQKKILEAIRMSVTPQRQDTGENLSVFATLSTTLAATLGTGNIVGVSTAIALGGPGAIFWCWITGILGMATAGLGDGVGLSGAANAEGGNHGKQGVKAADGSVMQAVFPYIHRAAPVQAVRTRFPKAHA